MFGFFDGCRLDRDEPRPEDMDVGSLEIIWENNICNLLEKRFDLVVPTRKSDIEGPLSVAMLDYQKECTKLDSS